MWHTQWVPQYVRRIHKAVAIVVAVAGVVQLGACRRAPRPNAERDASARSAAPEAAAPPTAAPPETAAPSASVASSATTASKPPTKPTDNPESDAAAGIDSPWIVDELGDVGPAGPATASSKGVVLVTRSDELILARLGPIPKIPRPAACAVEPVTARAARFIKLSRAPAMLGDHAYWVSRGRLLRSSIDAPKVEVLAKRARDDTTVAAPIDNGRGAKTPGAVAYVARSKDPEGPLVAKLWVEGAGVVPLTVEGAAGSSVALVRTSRGLMALSLEGRSGMSPVHAREITFDAGGKPELGEDVVTWVGGPSQPMTQITAVASKSGDVFGLLPLERNISTFGLAGIRIGAEPQMNAPVAWRAYPNGLDPAPVATGKLCGTPAALYARPAEAKPNSPQELRLAPVLETGLGPAVVLARSRAFSTISMAELPNAALIAYVADRRTWARTVRCRASKK